MSPPTSTPAARGDPRRRLGRPTSVSFASASTQPRASCRSWPRPTAASWAPASRRSTGAVGWVGTIFVDEDLRGRGLGTALTQAVDRRARAAGCASLACSRRRSAGRSTSGSGFAGRASVTGSSRRRVRDQPRRGRSDGRLRSYAPGDFAGDRWPRPPGDRRGPVGRASGRSPRSEHRAGRRPADPMAGSWRYVLRDAWGGRAPIVAPEPWTGVGAPRRDRRADVGRPAESGPASPKRTRPGSAALESPVGARSGRSCRDAPGRAARLAARRIWGQFNVGARLSRAVSAAAIAVPATRRSSPRASSSSDPPPARPRPVGATGRSAASHLRRRRRRVASAGRIRIEPSALVIAAARPGSLIEPAARHRSVTPCLAGEQPPEAVLVEDRRRPAPAPSPASSRRPRRRRRSRSSSRPSPPGLPPAARIASSASSRLKPSIVPVTTTRLAGERARRRRRAAARRRQLGLDAGVGEVLEDARARAIRPRTSGEAGGDGRARRPRPPRTAPARRARSSAGARSPAAVEPVRLAAGRRPRPASQWASSIAVVQPTCGMPSAAMIRSSGRRRAFWIARVEVLGALPARTGRAPRGPRPTAGRSRRGA